MTANSPLSESMQCFLDFSAQATGFTQFDLIGTGQSPLYYETVRDELGEQPFTDFLNYYSSEKIDATLNHGEYGEYGRNIMKLWFTATWYALKNPRLGAGSTRIVAPEAYPEGLVWRTIGANPPGAKAKGYGSWSEKPVTSLGSISIQRRYE